MPSTISVQRTQVLALRIDNHLNRQSVTTVQRDIVVEERVDQLNAFGGIQRDVQGDEVLNIRSDRIDLIDHDAGACARSVHSSQDVRYLSFQRRSLG